MVYKTYKWNKDAFEVFSALRDKENLFFLDSGLKLRGLGRFSFIGFEPAFILKSRDAQSPFTCLRETLDRFTPIEISRLRRLSSLTGSPFLCGFCGYLSYDLGLMLEKIKARSFDDLRLPAFCFGFYDAVITIDNFRKTLTIFSSGLPETNPGLRKLRAKERFRQIRNLLPDLGGKTITKSDVEPEADPLERRANIEYPSEVRVGALESNFTHRDYIKAINKAKEYIARGDIYQINLSQRFKAACFTDAFTLYRRLRRVFPSAFASYFDCSDFQIISSSPERFLRMEKDRVTTRPMKGTRPRGRSRSEDKTLKYELLNSGKDKAELLMIVDLERNDLGRVCEYGSVRVTSFRVLETYTTVFQTTSQIEGRLHKDKDRIDLIKACFPGGSITGCPKVRAMEIIEELEPVRRNIYTGCLGYLDLAGSMDFNILIRTLILKNKRIYFSVGGGIVADSEPAAEYEETLVKAKAMFRALGVEYAAGPGHPT